MCSRGLCFSEMIVSTLGSHGPLVCTQARRCQLMCSPLAPLAPLQKKGGKPAADEGENAAPAEEELDEIDRTLKELGLEPVGRAPSKCAS